MNILEELRRDHDHLRSEMNALESGAHEHGRLGRFVRALTTHAHLEDELLFRALEPALPAENGPLAVMRAEHAEIEGLLARLEGEPPSRETDELLGALVGIARQHFLKEEQVLFAFAERLLDERSRAALGVEFQARSRPSAPTISPEARICDLARDFPGTIREFERHGVDYCCGGKRTLAEACARQGIDLETLIARLACAVEAAVPEEEYLAERTIVDLVGLVLSRYHLGLRDELGRLEAMAQRASERHGEHRPELCEVARLVAQLRREMAAHLDREEQAIFPALLSGRSTGVRGELRTAEQEHESVGETLARLREVTAGFEPPAEACNTWRGLFHGLAELERETHRHVHLENNVLFPLVLESVPTH